jgi:hypothetical protein
VKVSNFNTIRMVPLCGKGDEWHIWSEKFLAEVKTYDFKDLLLGKLSFPKADDKFDKVSDTGKKMVRTIKLNEIAYTELILSIDVKASYGKTAFNIVKGSKSKDYSDRNSVTDWEKLKKKYEPVSAPSTFKLNKQLRDSSPKKGHVSEVWITLSEDFRIRLDDMGLIISENQLMIYALNNLPTEYNLQLSLLEKR